MDLLQNNKSHKDNLESFFYNLFNDAFNNRLEAAATIFVEKTIPKDHNDLWNNSIVTQAKHHLKGALIILKQLNANKNCLFILDQAITDCSNILESNDEYYQAEMDMMERESSAYMRESY